MSPESAGSFTASLGRDRCKEKEVKDEEEEKGDEEEKGEEEEEGAAFLRQPGSLVLGLSGCSFELS